MSALPPRSKLLLTLPHPNLGLRPAGKCARCGGHLKRRRTRPVPSAFVIHRRLYDCQNPKCGVSSIYREQFECFTTKRYLADELSRPPDRAVVRGGRIVLQPVV